MIHEQSEYTNKETKTKVAMKEPDRKSTHRIQNMNSNIHHRSLTADFIKNQ
jgi:hypothetical protein